GFEGQAPRESSLLALGPRPLALVRRIPYPAPPGAFFVACPRTRHYRGVPPDPARRGVPRAPRSQTVRSVHAASDRRTDPELLPLVAFNRLRPIPPGHPTSPPHL